MDVASGNPVGALLWVDEQFAAPASLPSCLGDSYLYALNPVYRGARDQAVAMGIRFADSDDFLNRAYGIAPLFALDEILTSGVIPFRGDVELLKHLLHKQ